MRVFLIFITAFAVFLSGFFRYFEILTEWLAIGFFTFHPSVAIPSHVTHEVSAKNRLLKRGLELFYQKRKTLSEMIHGGSPGRAVAWIIFGGIVIGWVLALTWIFFRDWHFVVAREVIETGLDLLVFASALYLLRARIRRYLDDLTEAKRRDEAVLSAERAKEDEILNEPEPDDDYGEPVGQFFSFLRPSSPKDQVHMSHFYKRAYYGQSIFDTIDDIRDEEDYQTQTRWVKTVCREYVSSGYLITLSGAALFLFGVLVSLFVYFPVTDIVAESIFGTRE